MPVESDTSFHSLCYRLSPSTEPSAVSHSIQCHATGHEYVSFITQLSVTRKHIAHDMGRQDQGGEGVGGGRDEDKCEDTDSIRGVIGHGKGRERLGEEERKRNDVKL